MNLLDKNNSFISDAIHQAFVSLRDGQEIDVIAAVVDRISYPSSDTLHRAGFKLKNLVHGFEGISMLVDAFPSTPLDLWSSQDTVYEHESMTVEQQCCLSFVINHSRNPAVNGSLQGPVDSIPNVSYSIELPLANTLFQNGKSATLFAQRWTVDRRSDSKFSILCSKDRVLHQQDVQLVIGKIEEISKSTADFILLTPPQVVGAGMGNIIRRLLVGTDPEQVEPASNKLEEAISTYNASGKSPPLIEIWAQVTPREIWSAQPTVRANPTSTIDQGHRFHRVLSGGGGWGNKQGLLSLDPDSSFRRPTKTPSNGFGDDFDVEAEEREALGEVVKQGDIIHFWGVRAKDLSQSRMPNLLGETWPTTVQCNPSLGFGSLHSNIDECKAVGASNCTVTNHPDFIVFKGHFGALSETGISVKIETFGLGENFGVQKLGTVTQTKLPTMSSLSIEVPEGNQPKVHTQPISHPVAKTTYARETWLSRKDDSLHLKQQDITSTNATDFGKGRNRIRTRHLPASPNQLSRKNLIFKPRIRKFATQKGDLLDISTLRTRREAQLRSSKTLRLGSVV